MIARTSQMGHLIARIFSILGADLIIFQEIDMIPLKLNITRVFHAMPLALPPLMCAQSCPQQEQYEAALDIAPVLIAEAAKWSGFQ